MKKINIILPLLLFVFSMQAFSQIKKANKHFELFQYAEAIPYYLKGTGSEDASEKSLSTQRLADCYRLTSNFEEARKWYEKAVMCNNTDPVNYYYLGQSLRSLGAYQKAADAFQTFNELLPDSLNGEQYYQFCIEIQDWLDLPEMAEIKNAQALNSAYSDFGPAFYKNGLVFTSDRRKDALDNNTYGWTNFGFLNLYHSTPEYADSFWGAMAKPQFMKGNFNQPYHDGPVCFSADFKRICITRTTTKNARKDKKKIKTYLLQMYSADIDNNGNISKYNAFPFNSNEYSVAHPTVSKDGTQIIFSSDMPGGFGGSDLYITTLVDGNWTTPENLGEKINTPENEVFPFWANDSVLFFSSEGHLGYGGLDIFRSIINGNQWSEPENLKKPVNSSYDDFGIAVNEKLESGFFSSNRPEGKGSDDIYAFRNLRFAPKKKAEDDRLIVSGSVRNKKTMAPLANATVFFLDPENGDVRILKSDDNGNYETEAEYGKPYIAKAMKNGYIYDCTYFRTPNKGETPATQVPRDLLLEKLEVDQIFTIKNIYYDLDKWFIREDAKPPLDKLVKFMKQYPVQAELSSHTDSRASFEYNMELSQKRAEAAVRYMILQGVSPSRITAKGYGETKLVNNCADGVECTEEQHQANRRTEFKITGVRTPAIGNGEFNPDIFKEGDVINVNMLPADFFETCLE
ncbi:Outer membrane protein OmpA [Mariniphaga anaerophila]|uniref:Outer membrane protein OmpA n=1 Tax=Mariniphaga anaerophila TaxID=1484053 RepID=A0A1M4ZSS9_9BACT|nr:OmpA family protein [Mariniphaga anaerophila]SHF21071.1 Outer membrane protein OmpA [Mariniphaga anaerophila]